MTDEIAGLILAGGQSRRMGGGDKALLPLGDGCLLDQVVSRLAPQLVSLALNANGNPARFSRLGLPVLADTVTGYAGPLAGILTGLEWAEAKTACAAVVTAAGDSPFLPADLVERLAAAVGSHPGSIAVACSAGKRHPTFALWPTECRDAMRRFLVDEDNRRVSAFIERYGFVDVDFPLVEASGQTIDPFFNINLPDDLAEAARLLQSMVP
ncbi:molybdenum cofactor guanylyltransferase MobA [Mesorhizobium sp. M00.F.Ca.ET.186.01.1.1]|nr:molybdenum cofactor guanylyltransferase MobA [bacterium M00.F.Ca.ET.205.01.1.1]TGU53381.1 molybdenum cofactor guanylyltransferase MobA [bacterium M00.F.Ca.ET.152.01.1.1]TGV37589.1 molybdenum cofactor guanylyltransferase MobA [Mesorhizobium sp. M00.F.Ca.ET.186.01.1.1]TGZ41782.1 molybdenum cofactor guanylyltransferase MobA [bacterium M00.F.Ca.ET.162.01.1.1]TIW60369.1 MAG: molybdenum cofactor guanylyltransferase MobA [Mesorhizobium sp.]